MRQELANTFNSSGLEILGVQEHRVIHQEPIRMEKFAKGTCLITSSGWRNERDAAQGGVGIMVTKRAYEAIYEKQKFEKQKLNFMSYNINLYNLKIRHTFWLHWIHPSHLYPH